MVIKVKMMEEIRFYRSVGPYGFLSNLSRHTVNFGGIRFMSVEHAYQYCKAKNPEIKEYIRDAPLPALAAIVGHGLFPWMVVEGWKEDRVAVMKQLVLLKFKQHPELRERLLETGDVALIENSKSDGFWGIGRKGKGNNALGKLLMQVREELRE